MHKIKRNESGFGAVYILLIIFLILAIAATGWLVYKNHNKSTPKSAKPASSASSSKSSTSTPPPPPAKAANQNIIKFPELGVEITVPDSIKDLTYVAENSTDVNGKPVVYARLTTQSLLALDPSCGAASSSALGVLAKGTGTYPVNPDIDTSRDYGDLKQQFTGFFIGYGRWQAYCSDVAATQAVQTTQTATLTTALSTLQLVQ